VIGRLRGERGVRHEPERAKPVVERHDDRAFPRQWAAVVPLLAAEPGEEPAAVNPDHHRPPTLGRLRPDVQVEAVLGFSRHVRRDVAVRLVLHAVVAEPVRRPDARPQRRRARRTPPKVAHRWGRVRNTLEHQDARGRIDASRERAVLDYHSRSGRIG